MAQSAASRRRVPTQLPALSVASADTTTKLSAAFSDALSQLEVPEKVSLSPISSHSKRSGGSACRETLTKRASKGREQRRTKKPGNSRMSRAKTKTSNEGFSTRLGSAQAKQTEAKMNAALARVGVRDVADLLENGVSGAAGPVFISKKTRQRQAQLSTEAVRGPRKLRQLRKLYATDTKRQQPTLPRAKHSLMKPAIQMISAQEGKDALEELLECLAQRQMQTVQLQRMMLGELRFRRDPHRLSSLVQDIGTLEAQLCDSEEEILQSLKQCEWFVLGDRAAYGKALATCAQDVVAELTDEATEAYNANTAKAHEEEWRLRIGVFLHSVPKIEQGSFETLVQHVSMSRKEFTDALAVFVDSGKLNAQQREEFEKLTKNMQSEAQVAMEMSWRLRDSQRRRRAAERASAIPGQAVGNGQLALDLQKQRESSSTVADTTDGDSPTRDQGLSKHQRRAQVKGAEMAVQDGIEDVRSGIRDMIARVRTRRQPVLPASVSQSVPVSPAKPRAILFSDDAQLGQPHEAESALSPPHERQTAFALQESGGIQSPLLSRTPGQSRLVSPVHSHRGPSSPGSPTDSQVFSLSASHISDVGPQKDAACRSPAEQITPSQQERTALTNGMTVVGPKVERSPGPTHTPQAPQSASARAAEAKNEERTQPVLKAPPSPIVSPRGRAHTPRQAAQLVTSNTKTSPIQSGKSGLWNTTLLQRRSPMQSEAAVRPGAGLPPQPTQSEKREQVSGTNWSQTQAALQAVMQKAAYAPPSASVTLSSDRAALSEMKRKHGALASSIAVALQTANAASHQQQTAVRDTKAPAQTSPRSEVMKDGLKILYRVVVSVWVTKRFSLRKVNKSWSRDKQQSRWYQMTELRKQSKKLRKADKYDRSVLVLQRFARAVPFIAARLFKRSLRQLRHRRSLKAVYSHSQSLVPELRTTIDAQHTTDHQANTVIQASADLQRQTQQQYDERLRAWRQKLMVGLLAERMPHNWEVQYEHSHETRVPKASMLAQHEGIVDGVSYINTKTGSVRQSHPNMRQIKKIYKDESGRCSGLLQSALMTLSDFGQTVATARAVLSRDMEISMGEYWQLLQGNQHTAAFTIAQPSDSSSTQEETSDVEEADCRARRVSHSPLTKPAKPSFSLAELNEDHLYGQSQIAPHRTRNQRSTRRTKVPKPVQVVVENRTVLSNMISDTKSRLSALLAKAMQ